MKKNLLITILLFVASFTMNAQVLAESETVNGFHISEIISESGNVAIVKITTFETEADRDSFLTSLNNQYIEILSMENEIKTQNDLEHEKQKKLLSDKIKAIDDIKKSKIKDKN